MLYTSYETGFPQIYMLDVGTVSKRSLQNDEGTMSFAQDFRRMETLSSTLWKRAETQIFIYLICLLEHNTAERCAFHRNGAELSLTARRSFLKVIDRAHNSFM